MSDAATAEEIPLERIEGGNLLSVPGYRGAAVRAGLKPSGALDLALVTAEKAVAAAGVFTRNRLPAAPVVLDRELLAKEPRARTIVMNAGIANAMTGAWGMEDARIMVERAARACGGPALVLSTGVIGVTLPREQVCRGIDDAADALADDAGADVAEAILTTDTRAKTSAVRVALPASEDGEEHVATVGGMAKGSGMIHPDMATMLAVVATDVPVEPALLDELLREVNELSFHEISVDGDTSTNDTVLLLAGGAEIPEVGRDDPRLPALRAALLQVMRDLARAIVLDGEGMTRLMDLRVTGAATAEEARRVADAVSRSSLVKTALAGGDPNWGRILMAAANAGVDLDAERLALTLGGVRVFAEGQPLEVDRAAVEAAFAREEVSAVLDLGAGEAEARKLTTDLTHEYVRINAEYTT